MTLSYSAREFGNKVIHFSYLLKILDETDFKKEGLVFAQFEVTAHHDGEGTAAGVWDSRSHCILCQEVQSDGHYSSVLFSQSRAPVQGAVLPSFTGVPKRRDSLRNPSLVLEPFSRSR